MRLYRDYHYSDYIVIPSNMNFLNNEESAETIQRIINGFKKISVSLIFSASIDGAILDDDYRKRNEG